jgi:hypothetical protein
VPSVQRRPARLIWAAGIILACDLAVFGVRSRPVKVRVRVVTVTTLPPAGHPAVVPPLGQAEVSGEARTLSADGAVTDPLPLPLTLNAERGQGSATIENAIVNGARTAIVWTSGTPLPITAGDGATLDLGPAHVDLTPTGATWALDGAARSFSAGRYHAGAAVAVGRGGLATPRDGVDFTADAQTTLVTRGVTVHLEPGPVALAGPGKVATTGTFTVTRNDGTRTATMLTFGPGPFRVTVTPEGDHLVLDATLNGPLTVL